MIRAIRAGICAALFGLFAAGGLVISFLLLPLASSRARKHRIVRGAWRFLVRLFIVTGLIDVRTENLRELRGKVIVANHPSLIDVVLLTVLVPNTYTVAKPALLKNPFFGRIVAAVFLTEGEGLLMDAQSILSEGGNVLIFPEGTRSNRDGSLKPLRRGAAQLALRAKAEVVPVRVSCSYWILGKGQSILDMGPKRVIYDFTFHEAVAAVCNEQVYHRAAVALTREIGLKIDA